MSRKAASLKSTSAAATKNKDDGKGGTVPRVTEEELLSKKPHISPEDVLKLDRATESKALLKFFVIIKNVPIP